MYKIDISLLLEHAECSFPASLVISSVTTGSRTILHMNRFVCTVSTMKLFPHRMAVAADHIKTTTENILTAQSGSAFPLMGALNGAWFKVQCGMLCDPVICFLPKSLSDAYGSLQYFSVCCTSFIVGDFARRGVDISGVAWQPWGETPCACCVVCPTNGSRTVVLSDT